MMIIIELGLMILGTILLLYGADWFLDSVRDLSRAIGVSALVLGAILVGLEPEEMLTAAIASGRGVPALAINATIGTNVTIVICAIGLAALLRPIILDRSIRRQALLATLISIPPIALLLLGSVTRLAGLALLVLFASYTFVLLRTDRAAIEERSSLEDDDDDDDKHVGKTTGTSSAVRWKLVAITLGGAIAMTAGGYMLVEGAQRLVSSTGLSAGIVGATIVSLATSAEMIVLAVTATRKRQTEVLVGGILGSFAYNLLVTLGLAAVVRPLPVDLQQILIPLTFMIVAHLLLLVLIWRGYIGRVMGGIFVLAYIAYLALVVLIR